MDARDELRARVHGEPGAVVAFTPDDESEDWLRAQSWDFWTDDDRPVDTLEELCLQLNRGDPENVAADLLRLPWGRPAPPALIAEAKALIGA